MFSSLCSRYPWLLLPPVTHTPELVLCLPVILTSSTVVIRRMRSRLKWSLFFFFFAPCRFSVSTPLIHSFGAEWRGNHVEAATAAIASVDGFLVSGLAAPFQTADRIKASTSQEHSGSAAPSCGQWVPLRLSWDQGVGKADKITFYDKMQLARHTYPISGLKYGEMSFLPDLHLFLIGNNILHFKTKISSWPVCVFMFISEYHGILWVPQRLQL